MTYAGTLYRALVIMCALVAVPFTTEGTLAQSILKNHDTYQPIDISADRLEMKQKQGRAVFRGSVQVTQGDMLLSSDTLTVFYSAAKGDEKPGISRLDAEGGVTVVSNTETLSGDWGVYDVDERLITIGGNVNFKQGDNTLKGRRLEFNLVSGIAKLDGQPGQTGGRVQGSFSVPDKEK